jgi:hypothetical protein
LESVTTNPDAITIAKCARNGCERVHERHLDCADEGDGRRGTVFEEFIGVIVLEETKAVEYAKRRVIYQDRAEDSKPCCVATLAVLELL